MNVIAIVFLYLVLQMCLVWMVYQLLKNPSVVDASWSGLIYLGSVPIKLRNMVVSTLLILWDLRCFFLGLREKSVLNKSSKKTAQSAEDHSPNKIDECNFPGPVCKYGIVSKIINTVGDYTKNYTSGKRKKIIALGFGKYKKENS